MKSVEEPRLLINRRLGRIDVLSGFCLGRSGHKAAGKSHCLPKMIRNGKHDAVPESIPIRAAFCFENKSCPFDIRDLIAGLCKMAGEYIRSIWCKPKLKLANRLYG